ncbi:hypothetical protein [Nocardioides zhouii]|uniref:Uncharacterized protein n=1 Tax=Nocardioides zhouii TaxID=1168729 RepID=A0A4Q2SIN5_9ACTN|nr:hypothetical protein [Nocardioides zhouii]RYC03824.1 hypothetical protein EUA94_21490 [Nocardioides zhouii]
MTMTTHNGIAPFRLRRTLDGSTRDVDPLVAEHLAELETLLGRKVFSRPKASSGGASGARSNRSAAKAVAGNGAAAASSVALPLPLSLKAPLTPRRPEGTDRWEPKSLAAVMSAAKEARVEFTLGDVIDMDAVLSQLSYEFDELVERNWSSLSFDQRTVLDPAHANIRRYLLAVGYFAMDLTTALGLFNFVARNSRGAAKILEYATISAARTWIFQENLDVDYLDETDEVIKDLLEARLSTSTEAFVPAVRTVVRRHMNDGQFEKLLDKNKALFPAAYRLTLIEYLKRAPMKVTSDNVAYYIPLYVSQIAGGVDLDDQVESREQSDQDFEVDFFTDDRTLIQVNRTSVKCAAQLFYTMVLGDELQVFDAVNYFTHKYLVGQGFEITDPRLRRDLQMYVFSNQFTVTDSGSRVNRVVDRTQPAERQMFYRQVFNHGAGQVTEDVVVNDEFQRLWKVLMLESAKYLERAQISPNPTSYVSRQNVMQAVEDLQYNLSLACTGMATVMTPLIYDELDFVTRRILMHDEVRRQLAPSGGSWWKVVETLVLGMKHVRPRATVLNNKARLGHNILRAVAEYDPATFELDENFARFISDVEAFITTQSILQESLTDDLKGADGEHDTYEPDSEGSMASPQPSTREPDGSPQSGEWDF